MAETEAHELQSLHEFVHNLVTDLQSDAITAQEALTASWQYSYLREELVTEEGALRDALLVGGDEFKSALISIITKTQNKLDELPNFQSQLPDIPRSEKEIRDAAALRAFAIDRIEKTYSAQSKRTVSRREFIHELVKKYGSRIPTLTEKEVGSALAHASSNDSLTRSSEKFAQALVDSVGGSVDMKADMIKVFDQDDTLLPAFAAQTKRDAAMYTAILDHLDCDRPDVLVDVLLSAPPTETMEQSVLRAAKLAEVAETIGKSAENQKGGLQFFSTDGAKGVSGGLRKGADGILSLVGEPIREMILAEKVNGTLRDMIKGSQKLVDRLGENFVRSAFFTHITQDLTKQLSDKTAVGGQARTVFDDLFSSIVRGPLDPALTESTEHRLLDYFELMRANANAPKDKKFIPPGFAVWDLTRIHKDNKTNNIAPKGRVWFPYLGLNAFGGWLTNLFSNQVDRTTAFLFSNPRLPGQLTASRRAAAIPTLLSDDMPLLLAIVVILVVVFFFVFPSNFNLSQLSNSAKSSAIFSALHNQPQQEKVCDDCKWPTTGCISQGPNTPFDSHSDGVDTNAVDIAAEFGTDVVSIFSGTVVDSQDGCSNYASSGCNGGYGNYVVIESDGKQYRFAHLAQGTPIDNGASVNPGTKIGTVDSSGNSTGNHLHFELLSGYSGSINDVLPVEVPGCVGKEASEGPNSCPVMMGGTENSCVSIN